MTGVTPPELRIPKTALFTLLYFAEGAPIGFVWWALPTVWSASGGSIAEITGVTSLLVLPWAFKFLWAPLVDVLQGPRWTLRGWILGAQVVMALSLVPMLALGGGLPSGWFVTALFVHAFAAATQDVAIDGLAVRISTPEERGRLNGWMQAGMLSGRALFGSVALIVRPWLGDRAVIGILIATLVGVAGVVALGCGPAPHPKRSGGAARRWRRFGGLLRGAARRRSTWIGLAFAATAGIAYEAVAGVVGPFLIAVADFDAAAVGWFFLLPAGAMALGALGGGVAADRLGRRPAIVAGSLGFCLPAAGAAILAGVGVSATALVAILTLMYLGIGVFTAASYALFMDLTDPALGSTQLSAFMGATNLCESGGHRAMGVLVPRVGYPPAFAAVVALSLAALPLLLLLGPRRNANPARVRRNPPVQ